MEEEAKRILEEEGLPYFQTGSSYICNPPVLNTDIDYAVLCKSDWRADLDADLRNAGYIPSTDYGILYGDFLSYRKSIATELVTTNLIVFYDERRYKIFNYCTFLAKKLNLLNKDERVRFFTDTMELLY